MHRKPKMINVMKQKRDVIIFFYCLIYLANLLKTNLTKFAVIGVKWRQKAGFSGPISTKITLTKQKERRKRKSEEDSKTLPPNGPFVSNIFFSKVAIIKAKSATIAFFSSPPFFLLALSFSPFLFLRYCEFGACRTLKKRTF